MADYQIIHVAIAPPSNLEPDLSEKVAAIVNKDTYDTRLLLVGDIPRIIAHCHSIQVAESMANSLSELGIMAFLCKDSDLHGHIQSFRVHTLQFWDGEVLLWDKGGQEKKLGAENVFLILKGRKQTYMDEGKTKTKMKFSLPATLLTGGIPIWRSVREHTGDQSLRSEYFIRLYDRKSLESSVEILQDHMDYSFLGEKMTFSALTNFSTLTVKLRELFPQAIFNEWLTKYLEGSAPSVGGLDDMEVKLRLIYMYYITKSGSNH